jgi:hypothetical protein
MVDLVVELVEGLVEQEGVEQEAELGIPGRDQVGVGGSRGAASRGWRATKD